MKLFSKYSLFFVLLLSAGTVKPVDTQGNNLLMVLGKDRNSPEMKAWKTVLELDHQFANPAKGVQIVVDDMSGEVESIFLRALDRPANPGVPTSTISLPFGMNWNDDSAALALKLGTPEILSANNGLKFFHRSTGIEVSFQSARNGNIRSIRFYQDAGKSSLEKRMSEVKNELLKKDREEEMKKPATPSAANPEIKQAKVDNRFSEFKKSILAVFKSYKESAFAAIKKDNRATGNFWNYKYTYATDLKIPGEKYNMLYSFPFTYSQLDFVSVLREGDELDGNFIKTYRDFEKKLMESFPAKEGWTASCIANKESRTLSDLEFRHDEYGSIVLDYCRSPKGKHVLYMRFLLYSN